MRDMRKWMNVDFISALDLLNDDGDGYKSLDLVIDRVSDPRDVKCGPKTEKLSVLSFRRAKKRMILRNVHMRSLVKIFGPDADAMAGKKVRLWVERDVKAFGDVMDCVRFKRCPTGDQRGSRPPSSDSLPEVAPLSRQEIEAPDDDDLVGGPSGEDFTTDTNADAVATEDLSFDALYKAYDDVAGEYSKGEEDAHVDAVEGLEALAARRSKLANGVPVNKLTKQEDVDDLTRWIIGSGLAHLEGEASSVADEPTGADEAAAMDAVVLVGS